MNKEKVVEQIQKKYPGKEIFLDPPGSNNPNEIIVEVEPTAEHPEQSLALAVVGKSAPHYHRNATEIYESVDRELKVLIDGKETILKPGDKITIRPKQLHSAEGDEAWFLTYSQPGWSFEDHRVWEAVVGAIRESWSAQSSFTPREWSDENPARGQCAVTALIIQDELGGEIMKCDVVGDDAHFYNKTEGGQVIDLTRGQFGESAKFGAEKMANRDRILSHPGIEERYRMLKTAVQSKLS